MEYKIKRGKEVEIDVTIPWSDVSVEYDKKMNEAIKHVSVKGFRKGTVPRDIAEAQVDQVKILSEVANDMLQGYYVEILDKENLKTIGAPRVNITKLAKGNDVEIKLVVAVLPEITLPKNWKDEIKKLNKQNKKEKIEVTDDDVTQELTHIANSRAEQKEVSRAAKEGDSVKVDFTVKQDGVVIENGTSKDHALVLGKGVFIPGFEEEIIGMKKDEQKTFELTFPKDYHAKNLAGKKAEFDVTLNLVEERIIPKVDDKFAQSLGSQFKTLDDLKVSVKEGMAKEKEQRAQEELRTQYLDKLAEMVDVDLPQIVLDDEMQRMFGEFEQQLAQSGMNLDEYLEKIGKTREDLEKEWAPQARKRVISALVLEQIADDDEIEIDNKDIEAEMNKTLAMYKGVEDIEKQIDMKQLYEYTKGVMRNNAVFDMLEKL